MEHYPRNWSGTTDAKAGPVYILCSYMEPLVPSCIFGRQDFNWAARVGNTPHQHNRCVISV